MDLWSSENIIHSFKNVRSIQIDTLNYCNRKCPWCPNSKIEKNPDDKMPLDLMSWILDQLLALGFDGKIHPYLNGEPLCDDRLLDIIRLIRKKFPNNIIFISTNGDYLESKFTTNQLFDAGLSRMLISDWDMNGKCLKYYGDTRIDIVPKNKVTWWYNRGGNIDVKCKNTSPFCRWVFEKLYINFKGEVILCCSDFYNKHPYGNLNDQRLLDIWLSDLYKKYRIEHFFKRGHFMPLCEKCNKLEGVDA